MDRVQKNIHCFVLYWEEQAEGHNKYVQNNGTTLYDATPTKKQKIGLGATGFIIFSIQTDTSNGNPEKPSR